MTLKKKKKKNLPMENCSRIRLTTIIFLKKKERDLRRSLGTVN